MTPTQRTLRELRTRAYTVAVVERWNAHAKLRQDLFGWMDVLAIREKEILGVQATSGSNHSARVNKLQTECDDAVAKWLAAGGRVVVWSWRSKPKIKKDGTKSKVKEWLLRETIIDQHGSVETNAR